MRELRINTETLQCSLDGERLNVQRIVSHQIVSRVDGGKRCYTIRFTMVGFNVPRFSVTDSVRVTSDGAANIMLVTRSFPLTMVYTTTEKM